MRNVSCMLAGARTRAAQIVLGCAAKINVRSTQNRPEPCFRLGLPEVCPIPARVRSVQVCLVVDKGMLRVHVERCTPHMHAEDACCDECWRRFEESILPNVAQAQTRRTFQNDL